MSKYVRKFDSTSKRNGDWKKWCDIAFSQIVRSRGTCIETGTKENLQCAHIISRSYYSTRWDFDNAFCLSQNRHRFYTDRPAEWDLFVESIIGYQAYRDIKERAIVSRGMKLWEYRDLYEALDTIRNNRDNRFWGVRLYQNTGSKIEPVYKKVPAFYEVPGFYREPGYRAIATGRYNTHPKSGGFKS